MSRFHVPEKLREATDNTVDGKVRARMGVDEPETAW